MLSSGNEFGSQNKHKLVVCAQFFIIETVFQLRLNLGYVSCANSEFMNFLKSFLLEFFTLEFHAAFFVILMCRILLRNRFSCRNKLCSPSIS